MYTRARLGTGPDMSDSLAKMVRFEAAADGCGGRKRRRRRWGLKGTDANRAGVREGNRGQLSGDEKTTYNLYFIYFFYRIVGTITDFKASLNKWITSMRATSIEITCLFTVYTRVGY